MSAPGRSRRLHPGEGSLLRLVDGNAPPLEAQRLERHLRRCTGCRARLRAVADRRETFLCALADAGPPLPERRPQPVPRCAPGRPVPGPSRGVPIRGTRSARPGSPQWAWAGGRLTRTAAAAVFLLGLGTVASVDPLRAWVADATERLAGYVTSAASDLSMPGTRLVTATDPVAGLLQAGEGALAADSGRRGVPAAPPTFTLAFLPPADTFAVTVRHVQAGGELHVRLEATEAAYADAWSRVAGDRLSLRGARLAIQNAAGDRDSYAVVLPIQVRAVTVRIEGRVVGRLTPGAGAAEGRFDLGPSR